MISFEQIKTWPKYIDGQFTLSNNMKIIYYKKMHIYAYGEHDTTSCLIREGDVIINHHNENMILPLEIIDNLKMNFLYGPYYCFKGQIIKTLIKDEAPLIEIEVLLPVIASEDSTTYIIDKCDDLLDDMFIHYQKSYPEEVDIDLGVNGSKALEALIKINDQEDNTSEEDNKLAYELRKLLFLYPSYYKEYFQDIDYDIIKTLIDNTIIIDEYNDDKEVLIQRIIKLMNIN